MSLLWSARVLICGSGLDIAKSVFQVHDIDAEGQVLIRRKLKRRYVLAFFEKLSPSARNFSAWIDLVPGSTSPSGTV
jgi:transposase